MRRGRVPAGEILACIREGLARLALGRKVYLGDSVYATRDPDVPGAVVLTTENGSPADPSNEIFLEPEVLEALDLFRGRAKTEEARDA